MVKKDFTLSCNYYDDGKNNWDFNCKFYAYSKKAKDDYGHNKLGYIQMSRDTNVIQYYKDKYGISLETAILDFIQRDITNTKLKGLGMSMLCGLLRHLKVFKKIKSVLLIATSEQLISFYKKYGFVSVSDKDPKIMIGKIKDIKAKCGKHKISTELFPLKDSVVKELYYM